MRRDYPDAKAKEIVANLDRDGWAFVGIAHRNERDRGLPDGIFARKPPNPSRRNHLVELKSPGGRLSPSQVEFMRTWPGCAHSGSSSWEINLLLLECEARR